jgi:hypothetical protein
MSRRPNFLTSPGVWCRTPRTSQSEVDCACAIEHAQRLDRAARWPERFMYALAAALFVYWLWM